MKNYAAGSALRCALTIILCGASFLSMLAGDYHSRRPLPKRELSMVNKAMAASDMYMRDRMQHIDSLRDKLRSLPPTEFKQCWDLACHLSEDYLSMRADSALHYSEIAILLARDGQMPREEFESRILRVNALSTAGIFTRALDDFRSLPTEGIDKDLKLQYWSAGRRLYGYMRVYVEGDRQFFNDYTERYFQYDDSLVANMSASDPLRSFYVAERLVNRNRLADARAILERLCSEQPEESNLYAMAAYQMAVVCRGEGNETAYATWLAKAAASDIKCCVKDGLALPSLAEWLYHCGELSDAFKYINFALEDAMSGNVRMRTVTIAALLPLIDEAYKEKINASRDELMVYFLLVTFLLLVTVSLIVVLMRMVKRGRLYAGKLSKTAKLQESYIAHFIGLCSTYATRLESLQKLVVRKLAAGQADELQRLVKTGKFAEDQNDEFYRIFDSAFLDIYPDYVERMNNLLRPEEQLELKKEKELTPELRIYAFVRLGVDESTRIAQILNYSVSTVYAYRNRMRNRAVDRENFDRNVASMGKDEEEKEGK